MIHLWLVDSKEIFKGVPWQTLAYTFSFELPQHEIYTMDDLFSGEMLVLVYDHDLLKICLTILPFPDVGLFLEVGQCTQIPTENNEQMPDHNDDMIQLELRILPCHLMFCKSLRLHKTHRDHHLPNCFHDCIKTGLCIFIVFIHQM
jgi:hypothetical protein